MVACHGLTKAIYVEFWSFHPIQAITLDIYSAYNTVWRVGLLWKLIEASAEGCLVQWA